MDYDDLYDSDPEDWPWSRIEHVHLVRDDDGWDVMIEIDGTLLDILSGIDDETAQDLIWGEIWGLADEYGVDVDKEVDYGDD